MDVFGKYRKKEGLGLLYRLSNMKVFLSTNRNRSNLVLMQKCD